jgi:sulfate/thiosulfate transport system permease protein
VPYRTEVASVYIISQVEADQPGAAAAVSMLLLVTSLVVLTVFDMLRRRMSRHDELA